MYVVGGLTVETNHTVKGLAPASPNATADVQVRFAARPPWADAPSDSRAVLRHVPSPDGRAEAAVEIAWVEGGAGVRFRHGDGSTFWVDARGRNVWAQWTDALTIDDVSGYLSGSLLGYLIRRRGELALHASCVVIDGVAAAIAGPSSMGKSSLAAAFLAAGDVVLADDVLAVRRSDAGWLAFLGSDHLRLDDRSVETILGIPTHALDLVGPTWDKWMVPLTRFGAVPPRDPIPLQAVFFLEPNEDGVRAHATRMTPSAAFRSLLPNTSSAALLDPVLRAAEFETVAALAHSVPAFHLRAEIGFGHLTETAASVRETMRGLAQRAQ